MPTDWYIPAVVLFFVALAVFPYWRSRRSSRSRVRTFDMAIASQPRVISNPKWDTLTSRQQQVARLAARGLSNSEIAHELGIKPSTVDAHLKKIYSLLQVHYRAELSYRIKDYID
jgi:DNA-binding NarL/FixJ family response regulator